MIRLTHTQTGLVKECPEGFSWTNLFFGFFVPLFRGMYGNMFFQIIAGSLSFGLSGLVFPFLLNKMYAKHLVESGYVPSSEEDRMRLNLMEIMIQTPQQQQAKAPMQESETEFKKAA